LNPEPSEYSDAFTIGSRLTTELQKVQNKHVFRVFSPFSTSFYHHDIMMLIYIAAFASEVHVPLRLVRILSK
jgi:hypothetical protein